MCKEQTANSIQIEYGKDNLKQILSHLLKQEFSNYINNLFRADKL